MSNYTAMKKVFVPVDFSGQSISAFRFALDIAAKSHGSVHLLHVISLPVLHDSPFFVAESFRKQLYDELMVAGSVAEDVVNHAQYPVWTYSTRSPKRISTQN